MDHGRVARVVLGLAFALGLAVLLAHPRVRALERRLGVTVLVSAGLPFLAMGAVFRLDHVGILTDEILRDLQPAFEFGLGWVGFVVGMKLDIRRLDAMPASMAPVIALETLVPMVATAVICSLAFIGLGVPWQHVDFARDALILAACAAPSAPFAVEILVKRFGDRTARLIEKITIIDELVALAGLGVVAIYFRPAASVTMWVLPSSAWLLVTLGLGGVLGIVTYVLIRGARNAAEELALLLGSVALSAGIAGYLALSVPVVCAIAGALLANLPVRDAEGFKKILHDVERPLYLIFLLVVGASWRPAEWQGWIIAAAFVFARVIGKRLGTIWAKRVAREDLPSARALSLILLPQSPISIVAIVSAATLYRDANLDRVRWVINAVILGGVLTELVVRVLQRRDDRVAPSSTPAAPDVATHIDAPLAIGGSEPGATRGSM